MSDFKLELNSDGVQELLKCPAMQSIVMEVAASTYPGYDLEAVTYAERCGVKVYSQNTTVTMGTNDMLIQMGG